MEAVIEVRGKSYFAKTGTISDTHLGFEDHGVFTWNLEFNLGYHQGTGHRIWDLRVTKPNTVLHVVVRSVLDTLGVGRWENLKGTKCVVLYDEDQRSGQIKGILNLMDDDKVFLFEEDLSEAVEGLR